MKQRYLEVTYCDGKPLAAYLHLPNDGGGPSARTEELAVGVLADYAANGQVIGLEITAPGFVTVDSVNRALTGLGIAALTPEEAGPLLAA